MPIKLQNVASISPNSTGQIDVTSDVDLVGTVPVPRYLINGVPYSGIPAGSNTQIQFNNNGAFGASANLVWDNANARMGIGTQNPTVTLDVATSSGFRVRVANALTTTEGVNIAQFGGLRGFITGGNYGAYHELDIDGNPLLLCRQDLSQGLVGIGILNPGFKLDVQDVINIRQVTGGANLSFSHAASPTQRTAQIAVDADGFGEGILVFSTANAGVVAERMRITSQGRVGIGTSAPQAVLQINAPFADPSGIYNTPAALILRSGPVDELAMGVQTSSPWAHWIQARNNNGPRPLVLNPLVGPYSFVGIGTQNPQAALDVNGIGTVARIKGIGAVGSTLVIESDAGSFSTIELTVGPANQTSVYQLGDNKLRLFGLNSVALGPLLADETTFPIRYPVHLMVSQDGVPIPSLPWQSSDAAIGINLLNNNELIFGVTIDGISWMQFRSGTNPNPSFVINPAGGNVGIGTQDPQATLDVNGIIHAENVNMSFLSGAGSGMWLSNFSTPAQCFVGMGAFLNKFVVWSVPLSRNILTLDITDGSIAVSDLPSSDPGGGSKQLWYDPSDNNRVKFAA